MVLPNQETIIDVAQQRAKDHPDRTYVNFLKDGENDEMSLSYGKLDQSARHVAVWMQQQAIAKGDRVLIMLPNGLEFVQAFYGCLYSAVLPVPLAHQMHAYRESLLPTLIVTKPRALISTPQVINFMQNRLPDDLKEHFASLTLISVEGLLNTSADLYQKPSILPEDVAYLQFSSGSTGDPKGVMVGHSNIMDNMKQAKIACQWEEGKGTALWLPLFHDFGLASGLIGAMYNGGFVILMTTVHFVLKPFRWLQIISKYRCAYTYAPPFAFDTCVRSITPEEKNRLNLSCWISAVIGSEPIHFPAIKEFIDCFSECGLKHDVVRPGFGMAETVIMFSVSKQLEALCVNRDLLETQGEIKLIDQSVPKEEKKYLVNLGPQMENHEIIIKGDDNEALPEGKVGEIMLTGPSVCMGYYHNPEMTEQGFRHQIKNHSQMFLGTGDLGLLWQGDLYFSGRIKDIIIIRGRNYYPHDIEFIVPKLQEIVPDCVMAYSTLGDNTAEQLVLAMEIQGDLLKDLDNFREARLKVIDQKVVQLIGDHFQISPAKRLYLRPGTIKKTSSGKIKHQTNKDVFKQADFHGLIACLPAIIEPEEETTQGVRETALMLFKKYIKQEPDLETPLVEFGSDSIMVVEFLDALEKRFPNTDQDIFDVVDEFTTLQSVINLLEEEQWQISVPV